MLSLFAAIIPDSNFCYTFAALKTGELTVEAANSSERVQKTLGLLDMWLEQKTTELKTPKVTP